MGKQIEERINVEIEALKGGIVHAATHYDDCRIPENSLNALLDWVLHGRWPSGNFIHSVIENKLAQAVFSAGSDNLKIIKNYCILIYNYIPGDCSGSSEKMKKWNAHGGYAGFVRKMLEAQGKEV